MRTWRSPIGLRRVVRSLLVVVAIALPPQAARPQNSTAASLVLSKLAERDFGADGDSVRIGVIEDVAMDTQGRIYVLDSRLARLSMFRRRGNSLQLIAQTADAEAQLAVPRAVSVVRPGHVLVLDLATRELVGFELHGRMLRRVGALKLGVHAAKMCTIGSRIYIYGLDNGTILHAVDTTGQVRQAFGTPFISGSQVLLQSVEPAQLLCIPERGMVLVANAALPQVRAYSSRGRLLWEVTLPDFHPVSITQNSDGSVTFAVPRGGLDETISLATISPGLVALQIGHSDKGRQPRDAYTKIQTRLLRLGDGSEIGRQTTVPKLGSVTDSLFLAASNYPRPRLALFAFRTQRTK